MFSNGWVDRDLVNSVRKYISPFLTGLDTTDARPPVGTAARPCSTDVMASIDHAITVLPVMNGFGWGDTVMTCVAGGARRNDCRSRATGCPYENRPESERKAVLSRDDRGVTGPIGDGAGQSP